MVCVVYDVSEEATIEKVSPQCRPQWQRHGGPWWPWWTLTQPVANAISHSILWSLTQSPLALSCDPISPQRVWDGPILSHLGQQPFLLQFPNLRGNLRGPLSEAALGLGPSDLGGVWEPLGLYI